MQTLQKAFSLLRLVTKAAAAHSARCPEQSAILYPVRTHFEPTAVCPALSRICAQWYSTKPRTNKGDTGKKKSYNPPSPYRNPGPRRYGYEPKFFTGGLLPRGDDDRPIQSLPKYKVKDSWDRKRALFGQNDYIDILGDGSIKPADLIRGPDWLIGFSGNEMQRLTRRMSFHGDKIRHLYPQKYHNIRKRIFFLYKKYNQKRGKRVGPG